MDVSDTHGLMKDETPDHDRGFVSRTGDDYEAEQGPDYFPAISAETVGSKVLWFGRIVLPPGGRTKAHLHQHHETAHYMLSGGEAEMWSGSSLQHFEIVRPGDYVYIPANVLHLAVNRGTEPAVFIATRNEPTAAESLVLYPEFDARVP